MACGPDFIDDMNSWRKRSTSATVELLLSLKAAKSRSQFEVLAPTLARPACTRVWSERTSWPLFLAFLTDSIQHKNALSGDPVNRLATLKANGLQVWYCRHRWIMRFSFSSCEKARPSIRSGAANLSSMSRCSASEWTLSLAWKTPKLLMSSKSGHSTCTIAFATLTQAAICSRQFDLQISPARVAEAICSLILQRTDSAKLTNYNRAAHPAESGLPQLREGCHHEALSHVAGAAA